MAEPMGENIPGFYSFDMILVTDIDRSNNGSNQNTTPDHTPDMCTMSLRSPETNQVATLLLLGIPFAALVSPHFEYRRRLVENNYFNTCK